MLPAGIPLPRPELGIRRALEEIARPNESLSQAKLIVAYGVAKVGVTGGIAGIGLNHHLSMKPGLVDVVVGIHPIVDEDEFAVGFSFVTQAILRSRPRSLECD